MKRKDLEIKLKSLGWSLNRHGHRHDIWTKDDYAIALPRHKEINEYTAGSILKKAEGID